MHRFTSCAPVDEGNNVKFHVDGCAYFWAVSEALLAAKESIWILGWWLSPEVYLRRPPSENEQYRLDRMLLAAAQRGVMINIVVFKEVPLAMCLNSKHTKTALEALHPNISVFRYPDHVKGPEDVVSAARSLLDYSSGAGVSKLYSLSDETLRALFGLLEWGTLFWAHHDKLVIVDQQVAFTGGLDLSFGRWDTIQHPIADAHAGQNETIFPGQDYNNARIMDYSNLDDWECTTMNRRTTARLGWEDISVSLTGPAVFHLCEHFVDRWNFIHGMKYNADLPGMRHYEPLPLPERSLPSHSAMTGSADCQLVRSVSLWSDGTPTENSIYHAYVDVIKKSKHFVYIENQFFITSTTHWFGTVWNRVGEALVERILRAAEEKKRFKVFVVLPAVPAFPGDLQWLIAGQPSRALMQLQYDSINRGSGSVFEKLKDAGLDPAEYIRFFNLRSYDRINPIRPLKRALRMSHGDNNDSPFGLRNMLDPLGVPTQIGTPEFGETATAADHQAHREQNGAARGYGAWDTVSSCYMLGGEDIRNVPWPPGDAAPEIDAFVCEEVYVHSKLLIVDDTVVICGSANLNDRSLKGSRDSEMALVIEDKAPLDSMMDGQPFQASKFAATFRRYLYRKHLGLLQPQDMRKPDGNFMPAPVPNDYDYGSVEDSLVSDPLSDEFLRYWDNTAQENTRAFWKVFAPVPDNTIKTWSQYETLYKKRFTGLDSFYIAQWGHVLKDSFSEGEQGAREVKEELSKIRGTLVEMPLQFLGEEDVEGENLFYNVLTRLGYA
ncbi:phospholipase D/nuclease [Aspergillus undulatus]|uniref:phospholipase D/nuclease n=1 Tax=Aspergillus undulatus TaxID=1810928 RepID=UPI003CCD93BB